MSHPLHRKADSPAAPAPPQPKGPPATAEGRDERGRFTQGNPGGTGNPFARRTAAFRRAIAEAVTEETIAAVVAKLAELALAGDVAAIKLFLAYTVGKPGPAVNPDTLDFEELRQYEQELLPGATLGAITTSPPAEVFVETARVMRPQLADVYRQKVLDGIEELDAADREAEAALAAESEERAAESCAAEAATGEAHGQRRREASSPRAQTAKAPPSDNGENGARRGREEGQEAPGRASREGRRPNGRRPGWADDAPGPRSVG